MKIRFAGTGCQRGFTLIEMMAMLVIVGVITSVFIKKYVVIEDSANLKAIGAGIAELNTRETLTWTNHMFSTGGYQNDTAVWTTMASDTDLGEAYSWSTGPADTGGSLVFAGKTAALTRSGSDQTTPGKWRM